MTTEQVTGSFEQPGWCHATSEGSKRYALRGLVERRGGKFFARYQGHRDEVVDGPHDTEREAWAVIDRWLAGWGATR